MRICGRWKMPICGRVAELANAVCENVHVAVNEAGGADVNREGQAATVLEA